MLDRDKRFGENIATGKLEEESQGLRVETSHTIIIVDG
jgi:hypothetical protein